MKSRRVLAVLVLVVVFGGGAFAQERSDAEISGELGKRIRVEGIAVDVRDGVVTLTGAVPNLAQKQSILLMALRTLGVRDTLDRITVVPAQKRTDEQIARSVRAALEGNLSKEELAAINIRALNGVVVLSGTLPSSYPKQVAGVLASWLPGVTDVRNEITVVPPEVRADDVILNDIRQRYRRNAFIKSRRIDVTVAKGVVVLTGIVDSFLEAEQAEAVARFTPGVVDVRSRLFLQPMRL